MITKKLIDDLAIVAINGEVLHRHVTLDEWKELEDLCESGDMDAIKYFMDPLAKAKALEEEARLLREIAARAADAYQTTKRVKKAIRIKDISSLFYYDETGLCYMEGSNVPMPEILCDALLDAHYNPNSKYTTKSLLNFWRWALLNPNPEARQDLFGWLRTGEFTITESGMIVAYRCVDTKKEGTDAEMLKVVTQEWLRIKRQKKSPKNYYFNKETQTISKDENSGECLDTLYHALLENEATETVFTDHHTGTMHISIGKPVTLPRSECDSNRNASCSKGLKCSPLIM